MDEEEEEEGATMFPDIDTRSPGLPSQELLDRNPAPSPAHEHIPSFNYTDSLGYSLKHNLNINDLIPLDEDSIMDDESTMTVSEEDTSNNFSLFQNGIPDDNKMTTFSGILTRATNNNNERISLLGERPTENSDIPNRSNNSTMNKIYEFQNTPMIIKENAGENKLVNNIKIHVRHNLTTNNPATEKDQATKTSAASTSGKVTQKSPEQDFKKRADNSSVTDTTKIRDTPTESNSNNCSSINSVLFDHMYCKRQNTDTTEHSSKLPKKKTKSDSSTENITELFAKLQQNDESSSSSCSCSCSSSTSSSSSSSSSSSCCSSTSDSSSDDDEPEVETEIDEQQTEDKTNENQKTISDSKPEEAAGTQTTAKNLDPENDQSNSKVTITITNAEMTEKPTLQILTPEEVNTININRYFCRNFTLKKFSKNDPPPSYEEVTKRKAEKTKKNVKQSKNAGQKDVPRNTASNVTQGNKAVNNNRANTSTTASQQTFRPIGEQNTRSKRYVLFYISLSDVV